jgi:hypothetical protein
MDKAKAKTLKEAHKHHNRQEMLNMKMDLALRKVLDTKLKVKEIKVRIAMMKLINIMEQKQRNMISQNLNLTWMQ